MSELVPEPASDDDLWIFGYGSLMWRPGFDHLDRQRALLRGRHRSLCVWSWHHRGSQAAPGLVMGLDHGGACVGIAYRVAGHIAGDVRDYLDARERVTPVYLATEVRLRLTDGRQVKALTYTVDRMNPQYAGRLDVATAVATVRDAVGHSGRNPDYVRETAAHLREIGVNDPFMQAVAAALRQG